MRTKAETDTNSIQQPHPAHQEKVRHDQINTLYNQLGESQLVISRHQGQHHPAAAGAQVCLVPAIPGHRQPAAGGHEWPGDRIMAPAARPITGACGWRHRTVTLHRSQARILTSGPFSKRTEAYLLFLRANEPEATSPVWPLTSTTARCPMGPITAVHTGRSTNW